METLVTKININDFKKVCQIRNEMHVIAQDEIIIPTTNI